MAHGYASKPPPDELPLGRLEAFSDGVFAIAITLLVLELAVAESAGQDLVQGILSQWPAYVAYVTSFLTIGAIWIGHSTMTGALRAADGTLRAGRGDRRLTQVLFDFARPSNRSPARPVCRDRNPKSPDLGAAQVTLRGVRNRT